MAGVIAGREPPRSRPSGRREGRRRPLRILVVADPYIPVPPQLYGGIERVIDFLVRGLESLGHEPTLLSHPESTVPCRRWSYGSPPHRGWRHRLSELGQVGLHLVRGLSEFDVVHSFGRLASLVPILPLRRLAKVQSYQRDPIPWDSVRIASRLAGRSIRFTACSSSMIRKRPPGESWGAWSTIHNGVPMARYAPGTADPASAPLAWLGRLEPMKGCHHAIDIAKRTGRPLWIAGNQVPEAAGYFEEAIRPHVDGDRIRYVGPVTDEAKAKVLGGAAALLMPIEWDEPFGIVMVEALACGTPVVAFRRGSVPEVVRDGVNGFTCDTVDEAVAAVGRLPSLRREDVRRDCERRFDAPRIVERYEGLYRELLADMGRG